MARTCPVCGGLTRPVLAANQPPTRGRPAVYCGLPCKRLAGRRRRVLAELADLATAARARGQVRLAEELELRAAAIAASSFDVSFEITRLEAPLPAWRPED